MSPSYVPPEDFEEIEGLGSLTLYQFGDRMVNHWFCRTCGIHPFHDVVARPGHYRVNLGCLHDFDPLALEVSVIDGKAF